MSIANSASVLMTPARGDLEQNRSKRTKRGTAKRTKRDFEKCLLRKNSQYM